MLKLFKCAGDESFANQMIYMKQKMQIMIN